MTEITFHIDSKLSQGCLAIRLETAEREGHYLNISKNTPPLTWPSLTKLAQAKEMPTLELLKSEELAYQTKVNGRAPSIATHHFNLVHVSSKQSKETLKLLAATGKLYFNGKNLAADFFSESIFYYEVHSSDRTAQARIKNNTQDFPLHECDFVFQGPPHGYIKGVSLKFITSSATWKEVQRGFRLANLFEDHSFEGELLEEETIEIRYAQGSSPIQAADPLPFLKLGDRTGAFANLWLSYGKADFDFHDPILSKDGVKRNLAVEKSWEKDLLETDFMRKDTGKTHYYCPLDKVAKSLTFLLELGWKIYDRQGSQVVKNEQASLQAFEQPGSIVLKGSLNYADHKADLKDVKGAFNRRERFIQLSSGTVGLLPDSAEEAGLAFLDEAELVGDELHLKKNRIGCLSDLWENKSFKIEVSIPEKIAAYLKREKPAEPFKPSADFLGTLRPYQEEGLHWLSLLYENGFNGILADDMGLGKTVQVLALLSRLPKGQGGILIVMPTTLLYNWEKEIQRFIPNRTVSRHHGPLRTGSASELAAPDIVLTSYSTLRLDRELFKQIPWQCLILDEAQAIKNPETQIAQAVCSLDAKFKLSITGTPVENNMQELWSQFRFLAPDLLGDRQEFESEISMGNCDFRYLKRIRKKIAPFFLRRKKQEVAQDLPEKIEQTVWIEMSPEQRQVYETFLSGVKGNLINKVRVDGLSKHRMEVLEAILRLRQICCHPLLAGLSFEEQEKLESAKLAAVLEDLETIVEEKRKVLVYSQFTSLLRLAEKAVREKGWPYCYLDGTTKNREAVVEQFQRESGIPIFLISLKAGGVGLNLTSADYVFIYDPWWNRSVEDQAIDRAHRIGRKEAVIAKRYICLESIEEKIMSLKEAKSKMIEELFEEGNLQGGFNEEDLLFLLE